jgi:hypothetical protein
MARENKKLLEIIFENMKKGDFPKFGSPETKCNKCMFYNIVCFPRPEYVGCLGGWKRGRE